VSTLDLISHGRVEFGIGEGSSTTELHPFGRRFRDKRAVWEEAVKAIIPMFGDAPTEHHGEYFDLPLRNVLPKPFQKPHPPLWVACSQLETIQMAGRRGMGALGFQFLSGDMATAWVHAYYNSFVRDLDRLADYQTNPNIALVSGFMCAETEEEAVRRSDGWTFFQFALRFYATNGPPAEAGTVNLWNEYLKWKDTPTGRKMRGSQLVGTPDSIRQKLLKFEESNIDQVILLNQAGRNTHEDICSSLELFAREVMPEFHGREEEHQAWKRAVLAGELELDEIDTEAYAFRRPTLPRDAEGATGGVARPRSARSG
jgi:alkanesulfonate monooxygenase SsuD/methylene tetrahydromethanopterin reductase-like flavin-dependent oxidoreductase (luciferase family)